MVRHAWEEHGGRKPKLIMIQHLSKGPTETDLNSKSEWGQPRVPTLSAGMPGEKRPAIPQADPDNEALQYYMTLLDTKTIGRRGKPGKVKIPWRTEDSDHNPAKRQ